MKGEQTGTVGGLLGQGRGCDPRHGLGAPHSPTWQGFGVGGRQNGKNTVPSTAVEGLWRGLGRSVVPKGDTVRQGEAGLL